MGTNLQTLLYANTDIGTYQFLMHYSANCEHSMFLYSAQSLNRGDVKEYSGKR